MWADAHAARRCLRYAQTCFAAALELPTLFSKSKSNAQSRLRQQLAVRRERRVAAPKARLCCLCSFPNVSEAQLQTKNIWADDSLYHPKYPGHHTRNALVLHRFTLTLRHFRQHQTNPAKQTKISKQTPTQTRNQKTAHKHPEKNTEQHTTHTLQKQPENNSRTEKKTDRTAEISRRKNTYVNKIRICEAGRRICTYAPNFSPFRK